MPGNTAAYTESYCIIAKQFWVKHILNQGSCNICGAQKKQLMTSPRKSKAGRPMQKPRLSFCTSCSNSKVKLQVVDIKTTLKKAVTF